MGYWKSMFILFSVFQCSLLQRRNVSISKRTCVPPPPSKTASHSLCNQVLVTSMQRAESGTLRPTSPPSGLAERKWEFKPPPPPPPNSVLLFSAISCQSLSHWQNPNWKKHVEKGSEGIWKGWRRSPHTHFSISLLHFTCFRASAVILNASFC